MRWMRNLRKSGAVAAATVAIMVGLLAQSARAQNVAPGGPIGNSLGFGSGLGGVVGGTGPTYPNGTGQPTLPKSPPPGGGIGPSSSLPSIATPRPHSDLAPLDPFGPTSASGTRAP